jgi:hypothetical protein
MRAADLQPLIPFPFVLSACLMTDCRAIGFSAVFPVKSEQIMHGTFCLLLSFLIHLLIHSHPSNSQRLILPSEDENELTADTTATAAAAVEKSGSYFVSDQGNRDDENVFPS